MFFYNFGTSCRWRFARNSGAQGRRDGHRTPHRRHPQRGATREEDDALAEDLLFDEKEVAEHVMLIDLGRNDVGRIAKTGSVVVKDKMIIERYSHVMHIVSNASNTPLQKSITSMCCAIPGLWHAVGRA